jgi:hypothetical protein
MPTTTISIRFSEKAASGGPLWLAKQGAVVERQYFQGFPLKKKKKAFVSASLLLRESEVLDF